MEQELDLRALWKVFVKRWKLILFLPLLALLISAIVSLYVITPQYSASTTLMITRPVDTGQILYQDIQVSRQLVQTYREIARSRRVLEIVIANRSLPYGVAQLREQVEVESVRDTELITVMVTDPDPVAASRIANEVAVVFMEQITEIMQIENVSVVDQAVTPLTPVSPRVPLNLAVAIVVGVMAAVGLAFLVEYLDQTIKEPLEAQKLLEIPIIGVVPSVEGGSLFTLSNPRSPAAEAFRTMRTNIQYSSVDRPVKVILVTGANPACGKSTISANLAVTLAQTGSSVLLVDADLRRPTQHMIFDIPSEPGLTTIAFKEELALDSVLRKSRSEKLMILPSGPIPPYPSEMLASGRMEKLVKIFKEHFDYVIFDSPPIIAVTDAAVISKLVDGTLIVLDYGVVRRDEAVEALEQMRKVQANVIGAVINNMPHTKSYYSGYNYYYHESESEISRRSRRKAKTL
jgi:polysaccharide biosynthesis transport protein